MTSYFSRIDREPTHRRDSALDGVVETPFVEL
jgi:hypothetical protein